MIENLYQSLLYLSESLMHSFWARALHSDVLPVPGGPVIENNTKMIVNHLKISWQILSKMVEILDIL